MDNDRYLPPHWSCHFDGQHRSYYYYNDESGVTQWENPSSSRPYSENDHTNELLNRSETGYPLDQTETGYGGVNSSLSDQIPLSSHKFYDNGQCVGALGQGAPSLPASPYPRSNVRSNDRNNDRNNDRDYPGNNDSRDKKSSGKGKNKKISSQMPQHMLLVKYPSVETSFLDINDGYSDMDGDDDGDDYTIPTFDIPEDRRQFLHGRHAASPIIGGINQDYLEMARLYKLQRPYSDTKYSKACVLCRKKKSTHVFFPCEHHCVCEGCIKSEEICADSKMSSKTHGCCNCPLCAAVIKKILPFDYGNEIELYWSWVYEIPPPLPQNFMKVSFYF